MSNPAADEPSHGRYVITTGPDRWLTDDSQLLAVCEVDGIAPVPRCNSLVRGIVSTQYGPLALLAPRPSDGTVPTLAALVQTHKGPVALAVDHVARLEQMPSADTGALDEQLRSWTDAFAPASAPVAAASPASGEVQGIRFLLIQSNQGAQVAIRAARVARLERCQDLRPVQGVQGEHHIVQAGGQLLHAQPLSRLLGCAGSAAAASWCLQMQGEAGSVAVLVDDIVGSIEVSPHAVQTITVAGQPTQWLLRPDHAPIEIVLEDPAQSLASKRADITADTHNALGTSCQGLRMDVGPYAVVVDGAMTGPVIGEPTQLVRDRRGDPHDVRVFHLDRLLGLQTIASPTHAIVLKLVGHTVVLLCDHVQPLTSLKTIAALPSLPTDLSGLLQGIGIVEGQAQLLLHPQPSRAALRALLRQHLRSARGGWMPPVWNSKEKRTNHAQ